QRIGHQFATLHNRPSLTAEWSAVRDMLAKHIAGRQVRYAVLARQNLGLGSFSRARRPEKNNRAVELAKRALLLRRLIDPVSHRFTVGRANDPYAQNLRNCA